MKRKGNRSAIFRYGSDITVLEGEDFERVIREADKKDDEVAEFSGNVANKGHARGAARIIRSVDDFKRFDKGDIVVSSMTTTDFTPYLHKAGAIVTDEGGITCHAAIVSRELGIPCIIGTKLATKVLKDGDKVDVDADNGVVRKL